MIPAETYRLAKDIAQNLPVGLSVFIGAQSYDPELYSNIIVHYSDRRSDIWREFNVIAELKGERDN